MRGRSRKFDRRAKEVRALRQSLVDASGQCMICGTHEGKRLHAAGGLHRLCCHEIANGSDRQKAVGEPSCLLVLCWWCNQNEVTDKSAWPQSRQLWLLRERAPERFDLSRFNEVVGFGPDRITLEEVDAWGELVKPDR